jgi:hypothetical protein
VFGYEDEGLRATTIRKVRLLFGALSEFTSLKLTDSLLPSLVAGTGTLGKLIHLGWAKAAAHRALMGSSSALALG